MEGKLVITLKIGPDGSVMSAQKKTKTGNLTEGVIQCVLKASRDAQFPAGEGGVVDVPFNFQHQK
jgi:hypothetical protein